MMPSKSREWLETECLRLAKRLPGGREIERHSKRPVWLLPWFGAEGDGRA
jgi:hypothetical protein